MKQSPLKTRIIFAAAVFALLIVFGFVLYPRDTNQPEYIFDKRYDIELSDVEKARAPLARSNQDADKTERPSAEGQPEAASTEEKPAVDPAEIFSEGLINAHTTLKYFKHLEHRFREATGLGEHFEKVRSFLFENFSEAQARTLFATYKKYLQCKMDLLEEFRNFSGAQSPEKAVDILKRIQSFRRQRLGEQLADKLYGAEVKAQEYALRRADIVNDEALYGAEKEKRLKQLNRAMWGDEAAAVEQRPNPYNRYREKLKIYRKDLAEMNSEAEKQEQINKFRKKFFEPETVARLKSVDRQMAEAETREKQYRQQARDIRDNAELDKQEKEEKIRMLQEKTFGEAADDFRRRESIRKGREQFIRENRGTAPTIAE